MSTKHYHWCFTINNYTPDHVSRCRTIFYSYIIFGYEVGPKTGTPHLQGYVEFNKPMNRLQVKKLFQTRKIYLSPRRESPYRSMDYCRKEGTWEEYGIFSVYILPEPLPPPDIRPEFMREYLV